MPTYTYQCPVCGYVGTAQRTIEYRDDAPECPKCRQQGDIEPMVRQLDAPMGVVNGPAVPRGSG